MRRLLNRIHPVIACLTLFATLVPAAAEESAGEVVERLHQALVDMASVEPMPDLAERIALIAPVVRETHDLAGMGQFTVRRGWRTMSEDERDEFVEVFERLSLTTYASRFASIGPDNFEILRSEATGDQGATVEAIIRRNDGDDVPMEYLLELQGENWRIVHVRADGVSELSLMRSEYSGLLQSDGFSSLIAAIESEIAQL